MFIENTPWHFELQFHFYNYSKVAEYAVMLFGSSKCKITCATTIVIQYSETKSKYSSLNGQV